MKKLFLSAHKKIVCVVLHSVVLKFTFFAFVQADQKYWTNLLCRFRLFLYNIELAGKVSYSVFAVPLVVVVVVKPLHPGSYRQKIFASNG